MRKVADILCDFDDARPPGVGDTSQNKRKAIEDTIDEYEYERNCAA